MRKRDRGFIKFMYNIDPKNSTYKKNKTKTFTWKAKWPGGMCLEGFRELVFGITRLYRVGDVLCPSDRHRLDECISWADTEIEEELCDLFDGTPIGPRAMEYFQNWRWRMENGEEPNEEEFYEETAF